MADIYILKIKEYPKQAIYDNIELVSLERKRKIYKYRFIQDAYRSLLGSLLTRYVICLRTGYKNKDLKFDFSKYGKPYLKFPNTKQAYFNFSHGGEYIVCSIDDNECGIDVESINNYNMKVAMDVFHENEIIKLKKLNYHMDAKIYATFLWTMKEAYLKALGVGLSKSLSSFYISKEDDNVFITDLETQNKKFKVYDSINVDNNYIVSYVGNSRPVYYYLSDVELMNKVDKNRRNFG